MSTTSLLNIDNDDDDDINFDYENDYEKILDMELSHDIRIKLLDSLDEKFIIEIINKLKSIFTISNNTLVKQFIISICNDSHISYTLKIEACKVLCIKEQSFEHFDILHKLITDSSDSLPIPCKILAIVFLSKSDDFISQVIQHLKQFINNPYVECDFRYKTILNIGIINNLDRKTFILPLLLYFIQNLSIFTSYRILASQNLLQNFKDLINNKDKNYIFTILYSFSSDQELDYNIRADATDVLLGLGDEHHQTLARNMIHQLGNRGHTIYDDGQNIHNVKINKSIEPILQTLFTNTLKPDSNFNNIKQEITTPIIEQIKSLQDTLDKLNFSLNRIQIDRSLYGTVNTSLNSLLCRVHSYITGHTHETELKKRLFEELIDASGKCSTGYGGRLANVVSGYDDLNIKISWEDSIQAKLSGRLNKLVQNIDDDTLRDNILLEMTLNSDKDILSRKNFLDFFRTHISSIKQQIYIEVNDDVDDVDFELYFRKAMSNYEGIKFL
jgi:hypothetical protein